MMRRNTSIVFAILLALAGGARVAGADELPVDGTGDMRLAPGGVQPGDETQPIYSNDSHWAGPVLAAIAGLFLAALVVGPIARAEAPAAIPSATSHEEDPSADRHDGSSP